MIGTRLVPSLAVLNVSTNAIVGNPSSSSIVKVVVLFAPILVLDEGLESVISIVSSDSSERSLMIATENEPVCDPAGTVTVPEDNV